MYELIIKYVMDSIELVLKENMDIGIRSMSLMEGTKEYITSELFCHAQGKLQFKMHACLHSACNQARNQGRVPGGAFTPIKKVHKCCLRV
jgi:hypothetical protein